MVTGENRYPYGLAIPQVKIERILMKPGRESNRWSNYGGEGWSEADPFSGQEPAHLPNHDLGREIHLKKSPTTRIVPTRRQGLRIPA